MNLEKIKNYIKHPYVQELKDVRVLGLIVFGVIVLLVTWSGVRVLETNYKLQRQIAQLEQEKELLELENTNKKLENQYYESDQYLEIQARKQFGKAAPGESVLIVPEGIALRHTKDLEQPVEEKEEAKPHKPFYQKNFEAWMSFFFRRSPDS